MTHSIILGVTGSIAAYKACEIVSSLVKAGINVVVVMTSSAQHFVSPLTFSTLSRNEVVTDLFGRPEFYDPHHVCLADRADMILLAPATTSLIGKLASGISDDILTCTVLASQARVLIAPAMDDRMYHHPIVQENIKRLKDIGYKFIGPVEGPLASGRVGVGRLAPVEDIVKVVLKELESLEPTPKREKAPQKHLSGKTKS